MDTHIQVKGARVHNLKNISVTLPRDQLIVFTGLSGSGKSSLAFDTIHAEGQRRYVESLSAYARQFLQQVSKPDVESIDGLSPTISIDQKTSGYNPRSTVGTVTEIYDYLRLLYSRLAEPVCPSCDKPVMRQSVDKIVSDLMALETGTKFAILAPIIRDRKGEHKKEIEDLRQKGFVRARIDGNTIDLSEEVELDKKKRHTIDAYVDRIILKDEKAVSLPRITESVELASRLGSGSLIVEFLSPKPDQKKELFISQKFACLGCGFSFPEPEPRLFSFNSGVGACPTCDGLGFIADDYEEEEDKVCPVCNGERLRKESLHFFFFEKNISDLANMPISDLDHFFSKLQLSKRQEMIGQKIIKEISDRLQFLKEVGVAYLSLARPAKTLSGGEAQRIRLASQIGSSLIGVTYILDEPSIGLHARDHSRLIQILERLRDNGNTVLVVEHDRETIEKANWVVDLGPRAGTHGGELVSSGTLNEVRSNKESLTAAYLRGEKKILPRKEIPPAEKTLRLENLTTNNLKNISVDFPIGQFICVTGVSGSGKSSLVIDTLYPVVSDFLLGYEDESGVNVIGLEHLDKVVIIDQSPIGRTPRSNPATYTGLFSMIRDLFASLPESQIRGYKPGRFSFNVKGGRCEACEGDGMKRVEMHFLPDVFVKCETCGGKRYHADVLDVYYKGKNISDVLDTTIEDALEFFSAVPTIRHRLNVLNEVGLGYLTLGQSATTLSGGEAQRMKLSRELSKKGTGQTMYILDEPSTGLHFDDVKKLVEILQRLSDQGNTVVVIEHNLDIINACDHVIDIGPEGGEKGGQVIGTGTPDDLRRNKESYTGMFLKRMT